MKWGDITGWGKAARLEYMPSGGEGIKSWTGVKNQDQEQIDEGIYLVRQVIALEASPWKNTVLRTERWKDGERKPQKTCNL